MPRRNIAGRNPAFFPAVPCLSDLQERKREGEEPPYGKTGALLNSENPLGRLDYNGPRRAGACPDIYIYARDKILVPGVHARGPHALGACTPG